MKKIKKQLELKAEDGTQKKRIRKAVLAGNHNELATVFEEFLTKLEPVNTLMKQVEESVASMVSIEKQSQSAKSRKDFMGNLVDVETMRSKVTELLNCPGLRLKKTDKSALGKQIISSLTGEQLKANWAEVQVAISDAKTLKIV